MTSLTGIRDSASSGTAVSPAHSGRAIAHSTPATDAPSAKAILYSLADIEPPSMPNTFTCEGETPEATRSHQYWVTSVTLKSESGVSRISR